MSNTQQPNTPHRDARGRPIVAVTGLGIVTSLGQGKDANWEALTSGRSGIHAIERFPTQGLRTTIGGTVDFLFDGPFAAPELSEKLAMLAAQEAVGQSGSANPAIFRANSSWRCRRSKWSGRKSRTSPRPSRAMSTMTGCCARRRR